MTRLADPIAIGTREARNRIVFGPHETNLGLGRALSSAHSAYYETRALGGAGVIITEEASVHDSDWPYERAPLYSQCSPGWREIASRCHRHGALVLAALGHSGSQGESAYHQSVLWGASSLPDVVTREVPKEMEEGDITALVKGFVAASEAAVAAGLDGVEVNAGQWSLLRQFLSALTNHRQDGYGADRWRLLTEIVRAVRAEVDDAIVGLRLSVDELAPWAGIVPHEVTERLPGIVASNGHPLVDYVTVVRGSAYATSATRPDGHVPPGFNLDAAFLLRQYLDWQVAVVAQGSIVDPEAADRLVLEERADLVEMTRAQIADPELARKAAEGHIHRVRPCVLCNERCSVRDPRNPVISCLVEPSAGHEKDEPAPAPRTGGLPTGADLIVVGGGPAGLECARTAALSGARVRLYERSEATGGSALFAARLPGRERIAKFLSFLERECEWLGVEIATSTEATLKELDASGAAIAFCTGSRPGAASYRVEGAATVLSPREALTDEMRVAAGKRTVVVWDPVGTATGVGIAELLSATDLQVVLVTPDAVAGVQLARTGDLAPASVRLARGGVEVVTSSLVSSVGSGGVRIEGRFSGEERVVPDAVLVDAGHALSEDSLYRAFRRSTARRTLAVVAGDACAPRTVHEAVLEGRRAARLLVGRAEPETG